MSDAEDGDGGGGAKRPRDADLPPVLRGRGDLIGGIDGIELAVDEAGAAVLRPRGRETTLLAISSDGRWLAAYWARRRILRAWRVGDDDDRRQEIIAPGRSTDADSSSPAVLLEVDAGGNFLLFLQPSGEGFGQNRCACVYGSLQRRDGGRLMPNALEYRLSPLDARIRGRFSRRCLFLAREDGAEGYVLHDGAARPVDLPRGPAEEAASVWAISESGEYLVSIEARTRRDGDLRPAIALCGYRWHDAARRYKLDREAPGAVFTASGYGGFLVDRNAAADSRCLDIQVGDGGRWRASAGVRVDFFRKGLPRAELQLAPYTEENPPAVASQGPPVALVPVFEHRSEYHGLGVAILRRDGSAGPPREIYSGLRIVEGDAQSADPSYKRLRFRLAWISGWEEWASTAAYVERLERFPDPSYPQETHLRRGADGGWTVCVDA